MSRKLTFEPNGEITMQCYLSLQIVFVWGFKMFKRLSFIFHISRSLYLFGRGQTNCVIVGVKTTGLSLFMTHALLDTTNKLDTDS